MAENKNLMNFEEQNEEEDTQKGKFLTFRVAAEYYAIEIRYVMEIIRVQKITEVPDTMKYLKGVINLRGKVIPVIDVRMRFNMETASYDDRTCIIVVNINDVMTGLIVDRVSEVIDIPETNIDPAPKAGKRKRSQFIEAMGKVGDQVKIILNVEKLLNEEEIEELKEVIEA